MIRRTQCFLSAVTLFVCLCTQPSFGAVTGRISGTVKDPTGAVIPNAEVTALETQTGIRTTTKTDAAGFYSFPSLPVGHDVKSSGFKDYKETGLILDESSTPPSAAWRSDNGLEAHVSIHIALSSQLMRG